jgi:large subunit ribosomal protein L12e
MGGGLAAPSGHMGATPGEDDVASSLAPKISPLRFSTKKIIEDIAKETAKDWKDLRMTVKMMVQNHQAKVLMVPSAAALVIKALKEPELDRKKTKNIKHIENISLDDVIEIAKVMSPHSMASQWGGSTTPLVPKRVAETTPIRPDGGGQATPWRATPKSLFFFFF